jgi:type IV pilus assembly protein PilC
MKTKAPEPAMDVSLKAAFLKTLQEADFSMYLEPGTEMERFASKFSALKVRKGSKILGRGKTSKSFVVIAEGRVSLWRPVKGGEEKAGEIDGFGYFGHDSILSGRIRTVTYIAEEDSLLFFMRKPSFIAMCDANPALKSFLQEASSHQELPAGTEEADNEAPGAPAEAEYNEHSQSGEASEAIRESQTGLPLPEEPAADSQESLVAADEPAVDAQESSVAADEPAVDAQESSVAADEPAVDAQESSVAADEPAVDAQADLVASDEPAGDTQEGLAAADEPSLQSGQQSDDAENEESRDGEKDRPSSELDAGEVSLLLEALKKNDWAGSFTEYDFSRFGSLFRKLAVKGGTRILGKGKRGNALIVIADGAISVMKTDEQGNEYQEAELGIGDVIGEESVLMDRPRNADFRAVRDSMLFYLQRKDCMLHLLNRPEVEGALRALAEQRIADGYRKRSDDGGELWIDRKALPLSEKYIPLFDATFAKIDFSHRMSDDERIQLRRHLRLLPAHRNSTVVRYGRSGSFFFIVAAGKMAHTAGTAEGEELIIREYGPGEYFGEHSLLRNVPRQANFVALENSVLLCLTRDEFQRYLISNQLVRNQLQRKLDERMAAPIQKKDRLAVNLKKEQPESKMLPEDLQAALNVVRTTDLFEFMDKRHLEKTLSRLNAIEYRPGAKIKAGNDEKAFYIIAEGSVAVIGREGKMSEKVIERLRPGDYFGQNELLEAEPPELSYYSDGVCVLYELRAEEFMELISRDFACRLMLEIAARKRRRIYTRKYPKRSREAERLSIRWSLQRNLRIMLSSVISPFVKAFITLTKALSYLAVNLPNLHLIIWVYLTELNRLIYGKYRQTVREIKDFFDRAGRLAVTVLTSNIDAVRSIAGRVINRISPHESRKCNLLDLAIFTRQMAIMMDVGLGLKRTFTVLSKQSGDKNLAYAIDVMQKDILLHGIPLSASMKRFPRIFDDLYVNLVRAGEVSGKMGDSLHRIANFLERDMKLKARLKAAMTYPIVILSACLLLLMGLTIFVMPTFVNLFDELNVSLPFSTVVIITFVKAVRSPLVLIAAALLMLLAVNVFNAYYRTDEGRKVVDFFLVHMALVGDLMRKVFVTRFCWTLASLVGGGISMMDSLKTSAYVITNVYMREQIERCSYRILEGRSLTEAFAPVEVLPRMLKDLVMVGEESGMISEQLRKAGDYYDTEIRYSIEAFATLVEPLMIGVMGLVIGFVVISLFIPIYEIVRRF